MLPFFPSFKGRGGKSEPKDKKAFLDLMHDVRNPMSVIYTSLEILFIKKWREDNQDELFKQLTICKSQLDRIRIMLGNYADLLRMEDIPVIRMEEKISCLLQGILNSFAPRFMIEKKNIFLDSQVESYCVDRNIFKQLVHNMIEHALFFAEPDSQTSLMVSVREQGLTLEIRYPGSDIKTEEIDRIFQNAERVKDQKSGVKYNKGFGLSYNHLMSIHLGGSFSFSVDPGTFEHRLLLRLP